MHSDRQTFWAKSPFCPSLLSCFNCLKGHPFGVAFFFFRCVKNNQVKTTKACLSFTFSTIQNKRLVQFVALSTSSAATGANSDSSS
jgi:hypothetical protein